MVKKVTVFKTSDGNLFEDALLAYSHECEVLQGIIDDYRERYCTSENIPINHIEKYRASDYKDAKNSPVPLLCGQGIYMWFDTINKKGYVGSSTDLHKRFRDFLNPNKRYAGEKMEEARKNIDNFVYLLLEKIDDKDSEYMETLERYYMKKYNTLKNGYNTL